jgi:hypothetical protein
MSPRSFHILWCVIGSTYLGWHPTAEVRWFSLHLFILLFGFPPSHVYVPHEFLMVIIVLEPYYDVMNHCVLCCQLSIPSALSTFTYYFWHYHYHDLMVQVIFWQMVCARTSNFALGESSASGAWAGASGPRGTAPVPPPPPPPPSPPPPPLPPVSIKQLLATQNEPMRVLTENLMQHEVRPPHHQLSAQWRRIDF